jgi:hypothetical protein
VDPGSETNIIRVQRAPFYRLGRGADLGNAAFALEPEAERLTAIVRQFALRVAPQRQIPSSRPLCPLPIETQTYHP